MKTLTKAEEQVMQVLWKVEKGFLKEILEEIPEPVSYTHLTLPTICSV